LRRRRLRNGGASAAALRNWQELGGRALEGETLRYRLRLAGLAGGLAARSLAQRAAAPYYFLRSMHLRAPAQLRIAPQDIRTADSTFADEIYAGYFSFDGKTANVQGRSPFSIAPPSDAWRRSLAGFAWLRHLRAADKALARANAQALVADFLLPRKFRPDDPAFTPAVTARRMLSWLAHSPLLLEDADAEFYEAFLAALARGARALLRALDGGAAQGADRLFCAVALAEYCVCADVGRVALDRATRTLDRELDEQILVDGGHIGRNPQVVLELLLDLLPLRQVYAARSAHPPESALHAIDRMIPFLRMMQHGDGSLALFNGMGATTQDRLATIFAHDDARGAVSLNAPHAGYQRMEGGDAVVIVDAGPPPPLEFSRSAHAGCLAFEFSLGEERIVVNCGSPGGSNEQVRELARATAAHSTLIIDDRSSCRIAGGEGLRKGVAGLIVAGPRDVRVDRRRSARGQVLDMSQDGYAAEYGLLHERVLALAAEGDRLIGHDKLLAAGGGKLRKTAPEFVLRFHIHYRMRVAPVFGDAAIELITPRGRRLLFEAAGARPQIEESIFFAAAVGVRKCAQIVLTGVAEQIGRAHV
jgi:uncharacterized heparinase superfamily protein